MFGHLPEFFIILVIGLIVFGPERLPEVAHSAGKMVRELRQALDVSMNPHDVEVPADFSTYYYESMQRSGEEVEPAEVDVAIPYAVESDDVSLNSAGESRFAEGDDTVGGAVR